MIDRLLWEQELIDYLEHHPDEPKPPLSQRTPALEHATTLPAFWSAFLLCTVVLLVIGSVGWFAGWYVI